MMSKNIVQVSYDPDKFPAEELINLSENLDKIFSKDDIVFVTPDTVYLHKLSLDDLIELRRYIDILINRCGEDK